MKVVVRVVVTLIVFVAIFYFTFFMLGAALISILAPFMGMIISAVAAAAVAAAVSVYVWKHTKSPPHGFVTSVRIGAVTTGTIAFVAGFFGPMILRPDSKSGATTRVYYRTNRLSNGHSGRCRLLVRLGWDKGGRIG